MLISIIIPTRERADYLRASLATCVAIPDPNIEIVVSDNASQDHTREVVDSFADRRIVYVNTGRRISMRQNFNFGIGKSSGDYVIMIGDDDGMLPAQFAALRSIVEEFRPNIFAWRLIMYAWPVPGSGRHGHVRLKRAHTFGAPTLIDTAPLANNLQRAQLGDLRQPAIYHGCVSRQIVERIRAKTGSYLNARAPDTYFANYAVFAEKTFLFAEHAFSIAGHGPMSTGGSTNYNPSDPRAQPNLRFSAEVETDPLREQFSGPVPTMTLVIFSVFEMVRQDWSSSLVIKPDHRAWYRWILARDRHRHEVYQTVLNLLGGYAELIGTGEDFRAAAGEVTLLPAKLVHALRRVGKNLRFDWRMTLSGRRGDLNTVETAASVVDEVLGGDYLRLTKEPKGRTRLWRGARQRALALRVKKALGVPSLHEGTPEFDGC